MALSYKNDNEQDERLNPASDAARNLKQQEQAGYDREFGAIADNIDKTADSSQEDANIAKTQNTDAVRDQEERGGWANNVTGNSPQRATGKLQALKKKGPLGLIIGFLLGGGACFTIMLAPGIGIVQMKEIMVGDLNDENTAMTMRSNKLLIAKLKGLQTGLSICSGPVNIRCKFSTMSNKQIEKFKKAGFDIQSEKAGIFGRQRITHLTTPGGKVITNPKDLISESMHDPAVRSALHKAFNPKFAGLSDAISNKVFARFKTDKTDKVSGDTDEDRDKSVDAETNGNKVSPPDIKGYETDDKGNYVIDDKGHKIYESGEGSDPAKFKELSEKGAAGLSDISERASHASVGSTATHGVLSSGIKGLSITGAADTACTVYNTARAVAAAAKVTRAIQLVQYAMIFLNTADKIKAGTATPGDVEYVGNILTAVDTQKTVNDETTISNSGSTTADNPFYGKNAFDSPGYSVAAYNDAPTLTSRSQQYMVGGGLTGTLSSVMDSVAKVIPGGKSSIRATCHTIQSWWARTAGLVGGIVSAIGSFGASTVISAAASLAIGFAMPFLEAELADIIAGTVVSSHTKGVSSGDAIFAGSAAMLGGMAMAHGLRPGNKSSIKQYLAVTDQVNERDVAMETYEAKATPFDINNQYSFLGSAVRQVNPTILKSSASLSGALLNIPTLLGTAATALIPHASAAETFNDARFSKCQDPGYEELKIDADVFCNVRYVMSPTALNVDTDTAAEWMISHGQIDEESGEPIPDSHYEKWVTYCVNRTDGWGETSSDDNVSDDDIGLFCMDSGENDYFQAYWMDFANNDTMDNGIPQSGASTPSDASTATGTVDSTGWAFPTTTDAIITSGYKNPARPDHRGVDLAQPGGALNKPIFAAYDGTVVEAGPASGFGNWIVIQHTVNGQRIDSVYGHMYDDGLLVKKGDVVKAGQQIGKIGSNGQSTGPHLHFELWQGGRFNGHEIDPTPTLTAAKGS